MLLSLSFSIVEPKKGHKEETIFFCLRDSFHCLHRLAELCLPTPLFACLSIQHYASHTVMILNTDRFSHTPPKPTTMTTSWLIFVGHLTFKELSLGWGVKHHEREKNITFMIYGISKRTQRVWRSWYYKYDLGYKFHKDLVGRYKSTYLDFNIVY